MAGGMQAEAVRFSLAPLALAIEADELQRWVDAAAPGDSIPYVRGVDLPRCKPVVLLARELQARKLVTLVQRREGRETVWIAQRVSEDPITPRVHSGLAGLMRLYGDAVATRQAAPTDAEAAELLGLRKPEQARWFRRKLIDAGKILYVAGAPGMRAVVTIVETGRSTPEGRLP